MNAFALYRVGCLKWVKLLSKVYPISRAKQWKNKAMNILFSCIPFQAFFHLHYHLFIALVIWFQQKNINSKDMGDRQTTKNKYRFIIGFEFLSTRSPLSQYRFKFPSILLFYQSLILDVFMLMILISFMDEVGLLCPSRDFTESLRTSTGFCIVYGKSLFLHNKYIIMQHHVIIVISL